MAQSAPSTRSPPLTAAVVIPTYNRPDDLLMCLEFLTRQTRIPEQIIVIDAGPDAGRTRQGIDARLPALKKITRFDLIGGMPAISRQRNAGVELAQSDICIFLDDDAMAQPDYVANLLRVYEADRDGSLAGVEGQAIEGSAARAAVAEKPASAAPRLAPPGLLRRLNAARHSYTFAKMIAYIGPYFPEEYLLPLHQPALDESAPPVEAVSHLYGCVMSFRTSIVRQFRFAELFQGYAFMEDFEISYRVGRQFALARCPSARVYHLQSTASRRTPARICFTYLLNLSYIARTCMDWTPALRRHMIEHHRRYTRAQFINGFLTRFGWSAWRGAKLGMQNSLALFDADDDQVSLAYQAAFQRGLDRNFR